MQLVRKTMIGTVLYYCSLSTPLQ